ncbi:hypothetical protein Busp01_11750 [Trinickia caryophylli]|nr:hypothetical protein Busp01_11750 [Trinickia caryophylli]
MPRVSARESRSRNLRCRPPYGVRHDNDPNNRIGRVVDRTEREHAGDGGASGTTGTGGKAPPDNRGGAQCAGDERSGGPELLGADWRRRQRATANCHVVAAAHPVRP